MEVIIKCPGKVLLAAWLLVDSLHFQAAGAEPLAVCSCLVCAHSNPSAALLEEKAAVRLPTPLRPQRPNSKPAPSPPTPVLPAEDSPQALQLGTPGFT